MSECPEIVTTQVELAKILNRSQPRINQLLKKGLPRNPDGTFNVREVTNWMLSRVSEKVETLLPATVLENGDPEFISKSINELNRFKGLLDKFKQDRGDIFCGIEGKLCTVLEDILSTVNQKDISALSLPVRLKLVKDISASISILYEKERLERNLSTDNVQVIVEQIKALKREREEEEREFKRHDGNQSNRNPSLE
jgi:hypothetical protein